MQHTDYETTTGGSAHLWQMYISDFSRAAAAAGRLAKGRGLMVQES